MTGPGLLSPLTRMQVDCLHARLCTAGEDLRELLYGENRVGDDARVSLLALQDEIAGLLGDIVDEMDPAQEREIGAARMAAAGARVRQDAIAAAERLLAAARRTGGAS